MSIQFYSPSYRASGSDLTIAVSPLGLVELADEEFEVHGPRLNRYAANWAWYLGHHWTHRREAGEPQLTINYIKAFTDYLNNFVFGQGVQFRTPRITEGIVPALLKRVWEEDNDKATVLWEMGQHGGVSGDCFVKVAYEDPYVDPTGVIHRGRVRILPLNSAFCFPEHHPHDRSRMIRFKLKYRFWGTAPEGTRQVYTYVEIMTDELIEEYINDELISSRPNPLGRIPIVHIRNKPVANSPFGLSDIEGVIPLNREYNEKATEVSDIVNYHSQPVTVITGAKASQLEKGARKVWGGLPKDARVFNLELGDNLSGPLEYMATIKRSMHELVCIPENALGQMQPISNTSGVALAITYMPLMSVRTIKVHQYSIGFQDINALVMRTLALKEPAAMLWDPSETVELQPGQVQVLDPFDPVTYETSVHWPDPLPTDRLIALNEQQAMMQLGLQSKRGALAELGEESPDEKQREIFNELVQDSMEQGALDLIKSGIAAAIMGLTGMVPGPQGPEQADVVSAGGPDVNSAGSPGGSPNAGGAGPLPGVGLPDEVNQMAQQLVELAYGTKLAQRRSPIND